MTYFDVLNLTYSALSNDPGEPEEQHHSPNVQQASHLKHLKLLNATRQLNFLLCKTVTDKM